METRDEHSRGTEGCPAEDELVALACGEESAEEVTTHVEGCEACSEQVRALKDMRQAVRDLKSAGSESVTRATLGDEGEETSGRAGDELSSIGKYRVISCLGEGGQASVYRAVHPAMEREVIIKLSRRATKETGMRQRLVEEGRMLAQLDHPGLARVHDLDFHEGRAYLVLEFVQGRSLSQYMRDKPLAPRDAARIVASISRALSEAHHRGIVHRDIKPDNILIDADGNARLIDFGIASMRDAWVEGGAEVGEISGTLEFMAPEQARGDDTVGPRSDLFSLGGVLYMLLTGKAPFEGRTIGECLDRSRRCDYDRMALGSPKIPRALARICLKAMAPEPEDRFLDCGQLATALEAYESRPRRFGMAAAAAAAALLLVALYFLWPSPVFQIREASLWRDTAQGPTPLMEGDTVQRGDLLAMKFEADRDLYVYVLNEDERDHRACLFPRPDVPLKNPVAGNVTHVLPGSTKRWQVTTEGGREHLFVVASVTPIDELEAIAARVREEQEEEQAEEQEEEQAEEQEEEQEEEQAEVDLRSIAVLLRGIDGVTEVQSRSILEGRDPLASVVRDLRQSDLRNDFAEGLWMRKIRLRNP